MNERDNPNRSTGKQAARDLDFEAKLRSVIGDSSKGLLLLDYFKKKNEGELKKLTKKLVEVDEGHQGVPKRSSDQLFAAGYLHQVKAGQTNWKSRPPRRKTECVH